MLMIGIMLERVVLVDGKIIYAVGSLEEQTGVLFILKFLV